MTGIVTIHNLHMRFIMIQWARKTKMYHSGITKQLNKFSVIIPKHVMLLHETITQ